MFSIEQKQERGYTNYILHDLAAGTSAVLTPERGGMLRALNKNGVEYLYINEENYYSPERPRCAMPVLFPTCGRMKDGLFQWEGKAYPMEIHGIVHSRAWDVAAQYAGDEASVTLSIASDALSRTSFPFDFQLLFRYMLRGNTLTLRQEYRNTGTVDMPFSYGFHPYFKVSALENARVFVQADTRVDPATGAQEPFTPAQITLPCVGEESSALFTGAATYMELTDLADGRHVRINFDESFGNVMLWSLCQKGFICAEPWNGIPDGLNSGKYLTLTPGASHFAQISIEI